MKIAVLFQVMLVAAVSIFPHVIAGAQTARGQDRGGGDTELYLEADERLELQATEEARRLQKQADDVVRAKYVKYMSGKIADGSFKADVLTVVNDPGFRASLPEPTAKLLQTLLAQGLVEDIRQSPYELQSGCKDFKGQPKTLATAIGTSSAPKIGASICVDMRMFVGQYSEKFSNLLQTTEKNERLYRLAPYPFWILFGLFMHDHARHFGVMDEDHTIAAQFSRAVFAYNMKGQNTLAESRELMTTVDQNGYEVLTLQVPEFTPLNRKFGVDVVLEPTSECAKNGSRILLEPFQIRMPEYFSISPEQRARIGAFCQPQAFAQGDTSMKGSKVRIFDPKSKETFAEAKLRTDSRVIFVRFEKSSKLPFLSGLGGQGATLRGDNFNSRFAEFDRDAN